MPSKSSRAPTVPHSPAFASKALPPRTRARAGAEGEAPVAEVGGYRLRKRAAPRHDDGPFTLSTDARGAAKRMKLAATLAEEEAAAARLRQPHAQPLPASHAHPFTVRGPLPRGCLAAPRVERRRSTHGGACMHARTCSVCVRVLCSQAVRPRVASLAPQVHPQASHTVAAPFDLLSLRRHAEAQEAHAARRAAEDARARADREFHAAACTVVRAAPPLSGPSSCASGSREGGHGGGGLSVVLSSGGRPIEERGITSVLDGRGRAGVFQVSKPAFVPAKPAPRAPLASNRVLLQSDARARQRASFDDAVRRKAQAEAEAKARAEEERAAAEMEEVKKLRKSMSSFKARPAPKFDRKDVWKPTVAGRAGGATAAAGGASSARGMR